MRPRTDAELQAKWDAMPGPWVKRKRGMFYAPNNQGYTCDIAKAGFYTKEEAQADARQQPGVVTAAPVAAYREDAEQASFGAAAALARIDAAIANWKP